MAPSVQRRKVWLTPTTRVLCSNAAKTRNQLKFAGVPQTRQPISSTCPHNMVNTGPLTAEICTLASLGHPSKFQPVSLLGSLLHRRRSTEANQALHDVWPSPALVHYNYTHFGGKAATLCTLILFSRGKIIHGHILKTPVERSPVRDVADVVQHTIQSRNGFTWARSQCQQPSTPTAVHCTPCTAGCLSTDRRNRRT